jgi:serine/threonine protein kinase
MLQKHRLLAKDDYIIQTKNEINFMKMVVHPNLLSIDFVRQEDNYIYLILPFAEGGDLSSLFKEKVRDNSMAILKEE